jgi:hypothetical protein
MFPVTDTFGHAQYFFQNSFCWIVAVQPRAAEDDRCKRVSMEPATRLFRVVGSVDFSVGQSAIDLQFHDLEKRLTLRTVVLSRHYITKKA